MEENEKVLKKLAGIEEKIKSLSELLEQLVNKAKDSKIEE